MAKLGDGVDNRVEPWGDSEVGRVSKDGDEVGAKVWTHGDICTIRTPRRIEPQGTNFPRHAFPTIVFTGAETCPQNRG